jgi:hypothetical protein
MSFVTSYVPGTVLSATHSPWHRFACDPNLEGDAILDGSGLFVKGLEKFDGVHDLTKIKGISVFIPDTFPHGYPRTDMTDLVCNVTVSTQVKSTWRMVFKNVINYRIRRAKIPAQHFLLFPTVDTSLDAFVSEANCGGYHAYVPCELAGGASDSAWDLDSPQVDSDSAGISDIFVFDLAVVLAYEIRTGSVNSRLLEAHAAYFWVVDDRPSKEAIIWDGTYSRPIFDILCLSRTPDIGHQMRINGIVDVFEEERGWVSVYIVVYIAVQYSRAGVIDRNATTSSPARGIASPT